MLRKIALFTTLSAFLFCGCSYAQKKPAKTPAVTKSAAVAKSGYKLYINKEHNFQFEIPAEYKMVASGDGEDYNLEAVTKKDKETFADFNGIVFSLKVQKQPLDASIENDFEKGADGEYYLRGDSAKKATKLSGTGFTGLMRIISCRVNSGTDNSMMLDGCESIYLSNGTLTLNLVTDGIAIEQEDLDRILKTLKFSN